MVESVLRPFRPLPRRYLPLVREVAISQHKIRDQSTVLGFLWSFLHPLILLALLYLIFQERLGSKIPHYPLFLLIGIVHYTHFSKTTGAGMRSLGRMRGVAVNVIFPKEILVLSSVFSDALEFIISMGVVVALAVVTDVPMSMALIGLPVVLLLQLITTLWISLLLAVVHGFVRDVDHIYEVLLRILFFATPIFYDLKFLSSTARRLVQLNPLTHLIGFSRTIILEGRLPPVGALLGFLVLNLALVLGARVVFHKAEPAIVERL
jgi:ABC-type polysaccharide/polyol phosphate export permease